MKRFLHRRGFTLGFTLLEVMLALALLGFGLVVLMRSTANNIRAAESSHMEGIAADLARGKMYEIEETLVKDGFSDTDQSQLDAKPFDVEGWPDMTFAYKVEVVEMPPFDVLQKLANGEQIAMGSNGAFFGSDGSAAVKPSMLGSGFNSLQDLGIGSNDPLSKFQNSQLGMMMSMMGGGFGAGGTGGGNGVMDAQSLSVIQSMYTEFQQVLKVCVRKVSLTVTYKVLGVPHDLKLVAFFTDATQMDQVLDGLGATDLGDTSNGSGSGTTLTGSGAKTTTTTKTGSGS